MKHLFLTILLISSLLIPALAHSGNTSIGYQAAEKGVGLGAVIAVVASWSRNNSIAWAILHGILSWLYVIYFALTRLAGEE